MLENSDELVEFLNQEEVLLVLDSSSILDIYKHDSTYSHNLLKAYQINIDKIWLPNQVNYEVRENHHTVKASRKTGIKKLPKNISQAILKLKQSIITNLKNPKKFNYPEISNLNKELDFKITELEDIVINYKNQNHQDKEDSQSDVVINFLDELTSLNRVGVGYDSFDKLSIYIEGNMRYGLEIPPGFMDAKDKNDDGTKKYGDLIIWKEVLDKISLEKCPLLFITSDVKCDWWQLDDGKKIVGKHQSLIDEFEKFTGLDRSQFEMLFTGTFFSFILETDEFISESYDEAVEQIVTDYSLNAENIMSSFKTLDDIEDEISEKLELEYEFSNGDFSIYVEESFIELEIIEILNTDVFDINVSIEEEYLEMDIDLESICDVITECEVYDDNKIRYGYDIAISYKMKISIPLIDKELIDLNNSNRVFNEENILDLENVEIEYEFGGINEVTNTSSPFDEYSDLCVKCEIRKGDYQTYKHEPLCSKCSEQMCACPDCGLFFPSGTIGAFCDVCENEH